MLFRFRMVDAVRAIRALEDGEEVPPPFDDEEAYESEEEPEGASGFEGGGGMGDKAAAGFHIAAI